MLLILQHSCTVEDSGYFFINYKACNNNYI